MTSDGHNPEPCTGWLQLPTGDRLPLTALAEGVDEDGFPLWALYLSGGHPVDVPLDGLDFGIDAMPGGSTVRLTVEFVDEGIVRVLPLPGKTA